MRLDRFPLGAPEMILLPGKHKYPFVLQRDFVYCWPGYRKWKAFDVCVPAGYTTDLLSIPRPLWPLLSPFGAGAWGGLPHDELYGARFSFPDQSSYDARAMADQILYDAAVDSGASKFKARIIFAGVRVGGSCPWDANPADEVSDDLVRMVEATERWNGKKILSV